MLENLFKKLIDSKQRNKLELNIVYFIRITDLRKQDNYRQDIKH